MKKKFLGRLLTMLLVAAMVFTLLPASAIAADWWGDNGVSVQSSDSQPFANDSGNHYRIPAIVTLDNGTLVAAADQRNRTWGNPDDCRDIDTKVAISADKGANWSADTVNDTGSNAPTGDNYGSGTYIDPALATDGQTVYMLVDLFPGTSGNSETTRNNCTTQAAKGTGVDSNGNLLLKKPGSNSYDYYLKSGKIYTVSSNSEMTGYTVDGNFNLSENGTVLGNLFDYSTTYFQPLMTSYLVFRKSTDGGKNWSDPVILNGNIKTSSDTYFIDSPGRGVVTDAGTIVFPCYSNTGSSCLIFSKDGGTTWTRTNDVGCTSSEGELVQLSNGTLRYFMRHYDNSYYVKYADAVWDSVKSTYVWQTPVTLGTAAHNNTDVGALVYSKTSNGKQVVLVSAPSDTSGVWSRNNGRIFVFTLDAANNMTLVNTYTVNNSDFSYSCMTELSDGSIGILYENGDSGGITYRNIAISDIVGSKVTFDSAEEKGETVTDKETGVSAVVPAGSTVAVKEVTEISGVTTNFVAYELTVNNGEYTGETVVTISVGTLNTEKGLYGFVVENGFANPIDGGSLSDDGKYFTFTAPHLSVVGVAEKAAGEVTGTETVTLAVGDTSKTYTFTGEHGDDTVTDNGKTIATVNAAYTPGTGGEPQLVETIESGKEYYISDGTNYLTLESYSNGVRIKSTSNSSAAVKWTFSADGVNSYTISTTFNEKSYYLSIISGSLWPVESNPIKWQYLSNSGIYYKGDNRNYYLYFAYDSCYAITWTPSSLSCPYAESSTEGTTAISFTGVYPGSGSVTIGDTTKFNVTVNMGAKSVSVQTGKSVTYDDASTKIVDSGDSKFATATLENGKLTIAGVAEGKTTITTETTVYTVSVVKVPTSTSNNVLVSSTTVNSVIAAGDPVTGLMLSYNGTTGTTSFTVTSNGATVSSWDSTDKNVATVSNDGTIQAKGVGNCYVIAHYSDGTQTVIPVRVVVGNTTSTKRMFTIYSDALYHSQLYCAVVSGESRDSDWTELPVGYVIYADLDYEYNSGVIFAAKPDDGYALTYMGHSTNGTSVTTGTFNYIGNVNGKYGTETKYGDNIYYYYDNARTGVDNSGVQQKPIFADKSTFTGKGKDGLYPQDAFEDLLQNAVDKGLDAAFHYTRQNQETGNVSVQFQIISDKLPTMEKVISSVKKSNGTLITNDGSKDITIEQGDTINYTITIQTYKPHHATYGSSYYGTISYSEAKLTDELTGMVDKSVTLPSSSTTDLPSITAGPDPVEDKIVTVNTSFPLSLANFDKVVNGTLTNEARLKYTYNAQYSKGTAQATADAKAQCRITVPVYIVDFGLPVTLTGRDSVLKDLKIESGTSTNQATVTATSDGKGIVYTPNGVFDAEADYVSLDLSGNQHYAIRVIPASNVLYEENFLSADSNSGWKQTSNKLTNQQEQKANETDKYVFGYDDAYKTATGELGAWKAAGLTYSTRTEALTTSFYGNGFDLIGSCGPNTGRVMLAIFKAGDAKPVSVTVVDTRFTDSKVAGTLYQVPWAHVELKEEAQYNVEIYASGCKENSTSTNSVSTYSTYRYAASDDGFDSILASLGVSKAEVEYINVADNANVSSGAASKSVNSIATYAGNEVNANTYEIEVDGFRVYRSSNNNSYPANEQNMTYRNILDVVKDKITAYTEADDNKTVKVEDYEANGGPQNEIYLGKGQAVTFNVGTSVMSIQVSLRAVSGEATWATSTTEGNVVTIKSNTEMYYTVTPAQNGDITIANRGDALLAIGNVKLPAGTVTTSASEMDETAVYESVCAAFATSLPVDPEPEQPTVFVPEHFSIRDYATRFFRSKLVTLRIDFSKDVSYVKIDGRKYTPNKLASWFGYYTVTFTDTIGRNDDYSYEVVFYDANNTRSETQIVYGK